MRYLHITNGLERCTYRCVIGSVEADDIIRATGNGFHRQQRLNAPAAPVSATGTGRRVRGVKGRLMVGGVACHRSGGRLVGGREEHALAGV